LGRADRRVLSFGGAGTLALTVPSKLQAYLAAARPIVGCIQGEAARIITEAHAGLVCPPGDGAALAEAMLTLHRMPLPAREAMGAAGRQYFDREFARDMLMQRINRWLMEHHRP
jgi:glycosyltransferase involved in cell wall biosynthesis